MTKEMREGLGLLCIATALALVSLAAYGQEEGSTAETVFQVIRAGAALFALGGLITIAVNLLRAN